MSGVLHPCVAEWAIHGRRLDWLRKPATWLGLGCFGVMVAIATLLPAEVALALRTVARHSLALVLLSGVATYVLVRAQVTTLDHALRTGWWAAVPVAPQAVARTLLAVGMAIAMATIGACIVTWIALAWPSGALAPLPVLLIASCIGIVSGTALALLSMRGLRHKHARKALRAGVRSPLFGLRWLDHRQLPHLHDWQRREALLRWRRGGNAWMVGAALMMVPGGTHGLFLPGLLMLALALAWILVVLRASLAIAREAAKNLAATPIHRGAMMRVALRYPVFALACAMALASAGIACIGVRWTLLGGGCVLALALLATMLLVTRPRAGVRA